MTELKSSKSKFINQSDVEAASRENETSENIYTSMAISHLKYSRKVKHYIPSDIEEDFTYPPIAIEHLNYKCSNKPNPTVSI